MEFDELLERGDVEAIRWYIEEDSCYLNGDHHRRASVPLVDATERQNFELVELLVELGAEVNASDCRGQTAIHSSAINGCPEIAEFLISKGSNVESRDKLGYSALMWATAGGNDSDRIAVAHILLKNGAEYDLNSAVWLGDTQRVKSILQAGKEALANAPIPADLIHASMWVNSLDILRLLLKAGADPNEVSSTGCPTLFDALNSPSRDAAFLTELLKSGADPSIKGTHGETLTQFIGEFDEGLTTEQTTALKRFGVLKS